MSFLKSLQILVDFPKANIRNERYAWIKSPHALAAWSEWMQ